MVSGTKGDPDMCQNVKSSAIGSDAALHVLAAAAHRSSGGSAELPQAWRYGSGRSLATMQDHHSVLAHVDSHTFARSRSWSLPRASLGLRQESDPLPDAVLGHTEAVMHKHI